MHVSTKYWIRSLLSIWLFFFATTADFVSTSVISGGHNANNPVVKVEHKCAGHWGKVTSGTGCSVDRTLLGWAAMAALPNDGHETQYVAERVKTSSPLLSGPLDIHLRC